MKSVDGLILTAVGDLREKRRSAARMLEGVGNEADWIARMHLLLPAIMEDQEFLFALIEDHCNETARAYAANGMNPCGLVIETFKNLGLRLAR